MCLRKIKQILWPTNQLGKDKQSFALPYDTIVSQLVDWNAHQFAVPFSWIGERLVIRYTHLQRTGAPPQGQSFITNVQEVYENGDGSAQEIRGDYYIDAHLVMRINSDMYFDCTNVTSLIVNGEQYI